jgi:hypothetical protein
LISKKIIFSKTALPNESRLGRKQPWKVIYKDCAFSFHRTFQGCFLPSFDSFGKAISEETIFLEINQSETRIACGGHVC